jgi:hypothetical protein
MEGAITASNLVSKRIAKIINFNKNINQWLTLHRGSFVVFAWGFWKIIYITNWWFISIIVKFINNMIV